MAFLSKSLSRRTVLKAAGASLSLPFLEAMLPPMRGATKPVHRFQAFYTPNGMAMEYWTPKLNGTKFEMPPILESMKPFQDKMLMFGGIKASWNYIHAGASGSFLTGTPRGGRNEIEIIADVSIDQMLGRKFEQETQLGSMQMSLDAPANAGACTGNLSCAYLCTLSWRSQTQPLPMDWNPRTVFEKMFDRFPNLRMASVENGSDYLAETMKKLTSTHHKMPGYFGTHPVETLKQHWWINPFWEDDVNQIVDLMGVDRVLFGSDWPHIEGMPQPLDYLQELKHFSDADRRRIVLDNVTELNTPSR